ncbi:MAG: beta-Ala-His dipeptidase [Bacteriovoracaceae bacterium]|nr:beta-Ala-His dipeptidase [Bacteriovoracaceae bacterium]
MPEHFPQEPKLLWNYFHELNQLPRPSKHEDKVREFIVKEASRLSLRSQVDEVGNVVVYVPASKGKEKDSPVIIQNHMDMVTDAVPEKKINFATDPITTFREGNWIKAQGTTLGADNGIGCAAALALMSDQSLIHPPLELLFTIDEETGLKGAWGVKPEFFQGKRMLNLDTEEWGSFYIGCAGGIDYELEGDFPESEVIFKNHLTMKLSVGGFLGGHSGVDIHEQRGNAIKFLSDILHALPSDLTMVHEIRGGKAHNIIPRDAWCRLSLDKSQFANLQKVIDETKTRWKSYLPESDLQFFAKLEEVEQDTAGMTGVALKKLTSFLIAFPHGAHKYDLASHKELVSLSNNLAINLLVKGKFYVLASLRFFDRQECVGLEEQIQALAFMMNLTVKKHGEYPSWKPVRENKLLDQICSVYEGLYHKKPRVTAIHAGLECGILRDKIGPIDAVSFGPTIMGAHSPDERVEISTVSEFWKLLNATLKEI